jgi:penicillin-binding protein 1A
MTTRSSGKPALRATGGRSRTSTSAAKSSPKRPKMPQRSRKSSGRRHWLWGVAKWSAVLSIWGVISLGVVVAYFAYDLPDIRQVAMPERRPAVTVVAADGGQIARYGDMTGDMIQASALPKHLTEAVLGIEDRRFYSHYGIDPIGVARALWVNWHAGRAVQGGSTITQQAAKNLFLTPERTVRRKIQEAILAVWLEMNFSKDQILTAYLNRVYFGSGTYGIDAAARAYFGVPAMDVNLEQAAILAGLLKAPSRYSPERDPEAARQRAEVVLSAMVDAGFITDKERQAADDQPPVPPRRPGGGSGSRYFADWVADQVPDFVNTAAPALRVETTLVPSLQRAAESIVDARMGEDGEKVGASQAALVAMRPDGAVVAMVGGRGYSQSQFNRAVTAQRQPGSSFKMFAYLSAVEQGLTPDSLVLDAPITIKNWSPGNYDGKFHGEVTAREALAKSYNTAAVRMLQRAGVDRTIELAHRLGINSPLRPELSLALGTSEVNLLELTAAYAALANQGNGVWAYGVQRIGPPGGTPIYTRFGGGPGEAVLPWHVEVINKMLRATMTIGTGRSARLDDRPSAGKSGTSQGYRDAWFIGFTADYVVGVWVGNDDGTPMDKVTGGSLPAKIWHDFMVEAERGLPPKPLLGVDDMALPAAVATAGSGAAIAPTIAAPVAAPAVSGAPRRLVVPPTAATPPVVQPAKQELDQGGLEGLLGSLGNG